MTAATLAVLFAPLMALVRASGLVVTAPILSARAVPSLVRVAVAVSIGTWGALSLVDTRGAAPPLQAWAGYALWELALGMLWGFSVRVALESAYQAGYIAGSAMGFTFGATIDPVGGQESGPWAQLLQACALAFAVAMGLHRACVGWLARSLEVMPPGQVTSLREQLEGAVEVTLGGWLLGAQLALPTLAAVMVAQLWLAIAGRNAAQLNLSTIGFTMTVASGGLVLGLSGPDLGVRAARWALDVASR